MQEDLFEKIHSDSFCYFGNLTLNKVEFTQNQLILTILLTMDNDEDNPETWQIICSKAIDYQITSTAMQDMFLSKQHRQLIPHQQLPLKLNFEGKISNPAKVFLELYQTHKSFFSNSIRFERYFNYRFLDILLTEPEPLEKMFAVGPENLIKAYGKILEEDKVKVHYQTLEEKLGDKYKEYLAKLTERTNNATLLSWGANSFIIANEFKIERLS